MTSYSPTLTGALAREHVSDLLRAAEAARRTTDLPRSSRHRTPRRRPVWWLGVTARTAGSRAGTPRTA